MENGYNQVRSGNGEPASIPHQLEEAFGCFDLICFETGSPVAQAGLELVLCSSAWLEQRVAKG